MLREVIADALRGLPVRSHVQIQGPRLSLSDMTSIVLLVNEAALNAAKHVFRPKLGKRFEVTLMDRLIGRVLLTINDDGPGMCDVPPEERSGRLGRDDKEITCRPTQRLT